MSGEPWSVDVDLVFDLAEIVRGHRLQPRWRSGGEAPAEDYECLCGDMFWGVAEWSLHVAALLTGADNQP